MSSAPALSGRSLTELYAGKRVLLIGGTGFLGSVTLSMLMLRLPALGKLYVLVRKSPGLDARRRFMERVLPGPAFDPVRAAFGEDFDRLLEEKVEVLQGDLTQPHAGLDAGALSLDLVLNASGLVDFHAPLDLAHKTNVRGTQHLIDLARETGAALVHTSTCYVAGSRDGHIEEAVVQGRFPRQADAPYLSFEAPQEDEDIAAEIALVKAQLDTRPAQAKLAEQAVAKHRAANGVDPTTSQLANAVKRAQRDQLNADLVAAGKRRAAAWGWPNVYTYTKAIAEQLLSASGVRHAIVRPAIIESALAYPLPGWNQNATTSAPLVMLALAGYQWVPARHDHILDVIPVDMVAWSLLAAGAAVMAGEHAEVYQVGTSSENPVTMGRVSDLLGLYLHDREISKGGDSMARLWKANREPRMTEAASFRRRALWMERGAGWLADKARQWGDAVVDPRAGEWLARLAKKADGTATDIEKARALWDVFMPFSHDHEYRFDTQNTQGLADRIAPEADTPRFAPREIDWRVYWLDVHVPGLEKWVLADPATGGALKALPATTGLLERIEGVARRDPHRPAVALMAGELPTGLSYGQLWDAASQLSTGLAAIALSDDTPVTLATSGLWPVALLAVWRLGRTAVLVRPGVEATLVMAEASRCVATVHGRTHDLAIGPASATLAPGLPAAAPAARLGFGQGPVLEARTLAERLSTLGQEAGIGDGDTVLFALPEAPGREADAQVLLVLATLYQQAGCDLVMAADWAEALEYTAPTVLVLGEAGWNAAPERLGMGAIARVTRVVDLAPASPQARRAPFWQMGAKLVQPLTDAHASAVVAMRSLTSEADAKRPFMALPSWKLRATSGQLEAAPGTSDDWQPCGWAVTALDQGGFRLEGTGREGPGARLEALLRSPKKLQGVEIRAGEPGEHGMRALITPDLDRLDSLQALRRHALELAWRYNQQAAFAERVLAVGLTLAPGEEPAVWLDTRHKPALDEAADLDELREQAIALVSPRLTPAALEFYVERLDRERLTFERLSSWERVVVKALKAGDMPAQGFLQAFEKELARTRTPGYRVARLFGQALGRVSTWAADEQPEAPLLPEPVNEAVRKGLGLAAMAFYRHGLSVTVKGASYIPAGENFLVVANHASHLDGGLVKYALGAWGDRLHTLAAKDYFFGSPGRRFVAHHFTRLVPTDRKSASTEWLRKAREILAMGDCVLIFPEGTRTPGPDLASFKASMGTLARQAEVAILPIRIEGTDAILPKGAALPRGREVTIHVGPPIPWSLLHERTAGLGAIAQDRAIAALVQEAVDGLPEGRFWWLPGWKERRPLGEPAIEAEVLP